ncbi:MAG: class I SAM-dependent methyltransferase [Psychrobium sp.]|nr:class I SAM-dependent methyltransferase [Psychrobium sp.]
MQTLLTQLRLGQLDDQAKRLFHGRGKCFPGLEQVTIDWFSPAIFITLFSEYSDEFEQQIIDVIAQAFPDFDGALLLQRRFLQGSPVELLRGELPQPHHVIENGITYQVKLLDGQNNGLFLDMANGRQWIKEHSKDCNVLNLFSYSCSFSLAAIAGGATSVVNIDMSHGALKLGKINHLLNKMDCSNIKFFRHDIFKSWGKLKRYGPYQTIIFDPPTNQVGSFVARKDYGKLLRKIPLLATDNADLLICLNSPDLGKQFIEQLMSEHAPECEFVATVDNPSVFQELEKDKGLKVYHYRYKAPA